MWKHLFGTKRPTSLPITIVSGLPRSGTSLMMQMLKAGGMEVVMDNMRRPDDDNPHGYYEFEPVKKIKEDASFLDSAHGKVFKMVSMLLYDLPKDKPYKIVFMRRHLKEMLASQRIMLQKRGKTVQDSDDVAMARLFQKHLDEITSWLVQQPHMDVVYINYNDLMQSPITSAATLNHFLGNRLDVHKMVAAVDPNLYRNRAAPSESGVARG